MSRKAWPEIKALIEADLNRHTRLSGNRSFLRHFIRNRSFRYMFWLRLCDHTNPIIRLSAMFCRERLSKKTGIQILPGTRIGGGFLISHGISVVIHPLTQIGENCNVSQFSTIGSIKNTPPKIGNNVYIGPGCCLVEDIVIGDNVMIGAGSIVVKDVPANCTVAGNPARKISDNFRVAPEPKKQFSS